MKTLTSTLVVGKAGGVRAISLPSFSLRVTQGPDAGLSTEFAEPRVVIGTGGGAGFRLGDPTVSAVHCEVVATLEGFRITDLGSKNGVRFARRRVATVWLADGDELELGASRLRFELEEGGAELPLPDRAALGLMRGGSIAMRTLYAQIEGAARTDASVLFQGETGSGKGLAVEALVDASRRRRGPLVVLDCGALSASLAESELFGHEKGAFTGASEAVAGVFERAHGGTLFLDEVGELPLELQPKLLGVLERRCVTRLGSDAVIPVDLRVVAATHRALEVEVNRGHFRADLFYRLAQLQIHVPSLRERVEDVPSLVELFLEGRPGLPPAVLTNLYDRDYPGNVRELRNAVERAVLGLPALQGQALPAGSDRSGDIDLAVPFLAQRERMVDAFERRYLKALLRECAGNVSEAARRSGLSRSYLHERIRRLG